MNSSVYRRARISAQDDLDAINQEIADAIHEAHEAEERESSTGTKGITYTAALIARGRLKEARRVFESRGWDVLPQGIRGQRILAWGADHAYRAGPANPKRSVRNWCRRWAPWLKPAALDKIVARTATSNHRWSADQSATVLEISVRDRPALALHFIGANDDPDCEIRLTIKREKAAERARRYRAAHCTGKKRGRPASEGLKPWDVIGVSRRTYFRRKARGTDIPSRHIDSIESIDRSKKQKRDAFSVPPPPLQARTLNVEGIDLARFGIVAIHVLHKNTVLASWHSQDAA